MASTSFNNVIVNITYTDKYILDFAHLSLIFLCLDDVDFEHYMQVYIQRLYMLYICIATDHVVEVACSMAVPLVEKYYKRYDK